MPEKNLRKEFNISKYQNIIYIIFMNFLYINLILLKTRAASKRLSLVPPLSLPLHPLRLPFLPRFLSISIQSLAWHRRNLKKQLGRRPSAEICNPVSCAVPIYFLDMACFYKKNLMTKIYLYYLVFICGSKPAKKCPEPNYYTNDKKKTLSKESLWTSFLKQSFKVV